MFPQHLIKHFWNEKTFFTDGYFVSNIGEVSSETLKKYIQKQG
ncbi:transposase IS200 like family protein [[Clostridium] sordellii VPI 9048]|nr:transposase IS200 like family protein [[Clostridium] sordellii VPI 9048] [Paeniclostridium sordellii VPI 9048]